MTRHRLSVGVCVVAASVMVGGCSSGQDATPESGPVGSERAPAETTGSSSAVVPSAPSTTSISADKFDRHAPTSSTIPEEVDALSSAITVMTQGRLVLFTPDGDCAEAALAGLPADARRLVDALIDDPIGGRSTDPEAAEDVFAAFLGCMEAETLRLSLVLSVLRMNETECIVDAWDGLVSAESVASSMAYGDLLDDLPADVIDQMAPAAAACGPDRQWWIDDVIYHDELRLDRSEQVLECAAARYVDVMGVEEVIRRRLLNAPLLAVALEDEARLDLAARCDVTESGRLDLFVADVGACAADARAGTAEIAETACDQPHDGEVFAVHDIAAAHPTWPGVRAIIDTATSRCTADPDAIAGDPGDHQFLWIYPMRRTWEQGDRMVLCLIVHEGDGVWNAPSGLVPAAAVPPTTTVPPTTAPPTTVPPPPAPPEPAPTGTTLPPGAREMFDVQEVDRPGMCIYRTPALPGQADLDRRFFEVDCSAPHQAEMYHRFTIDGAPGSLYPGDAAIQAQADPVCAMTFAAYVGLPYEQSRLDFVYFYPSVYTWKNGDRSVICFLVGTVEDEIFNRSMAGSRE